MSVYERLRELFDKPPRAFSPAPIWWWSGDPLDTQRLRWQMDRFVEGGVFNLVILNLAPTGPLYGSDPDQPRFFSEAWWQIFEDVCVYAEEKGISLWFYDQIGFSGANIQGEIVRKAPEFAGRWLESTHVEGEGDLALTCPWNGEPLAAGAVQIDEEGRAIGPVIHVPIEDGVARIHVEGRHRLRMAYSIQRGFDYFNPDACRKLLETVHGAYEARVGKHFGKAIVGSFQDELPSLPSWGPEFGRRFAERWGYAIEPHLIALWERDDEKSREVRVHYHRLRAEMAEEALFKPMFAWHERHGLICGFDQQSPSRAGEPSATVQQYADYIATHRWYQAPGSDHHGDAKIHSSMAHLYGRKRVWIESFHSSGWGGTIEETFDWLLPWFRAGATLYNPHAVYYSTRGGWWEWAAPSTCWRQPYWKHYAQFAAAIARLSAVLSEGVHVCDIGLLFPTVTIQAGLAPAGATPDAERAHRAYMDLVGVMHWQKPDPGVLDQDARDYDVLDDASVKRGEVKDGALVIGDERFSVIVTPGCTVMDAGVARTLLRFARTGGTWIAVGALPEQIIGDGAEELSAEISAAHRLGLIKHIEKAADLPDALAACARLVDAPVPTLLRKVGDAHILYVPAAFPCATVHHNRTTQALRYEFNPESYARTMRVSVQGVSGRPELWDVMTGSRRPLEVKYEDGCALVDVTFDSGPAALVVWPGGESSKAAEVEQGDIGRGSDSEAILHEFPEEWIAEIEPTLDNRYGDFNKPDDPSRVPPETWFFRHRMLSESGSSASGAESTGEGHKRVQATFGTYGRWIGPLPEGELPAPSELPDEDAADASGWRDAVYSLSRGVPYDPIHYNTLGPKGHVPEEFCRFGRVKKGESVQFCTRVRLGHEQSGPLHLALAAPAAKAVWVNGEEIEMPGEGYLAMVPVRLVAGENVLVWRLTAESDVSDLRSYWALIRRPDAFARPEWITSDDEARRDSMLRFSVTCHLPFDPVAATLQLGADAPARILVNGIEAGRQGGFDPYYTTERVQPYEVDTLRRGPNEIVIEAQDLGRRCSILVDALVKGPDGQEISIVSGEDWQVCRDDGPSGPVRLRRRQWVDPAWSHLWRRPHPLPGAMWIEEREAPDVVVPVTPDAFMPKGRIEEFQWILPPGAERAAIPVSGEAQLWVDGEEVEIERAEAQTDGAGPGCLLYKAALPRPGGLKRIATLRVKPLDGRTGGAIFSGPIRYECTAGSIALGDWTEQGLDAYSGAVRYFRSFDVETPRPEGRMTLDLGSVRGTVEVRVNGVPVGVRVLAPYRFDVTGAVRLGENRLEILVCNTLGPYLKAASPTPYIFPGQERSGVFGPVRLYVSV